MTSPYGSQQRRAPRICAGQLCSTPGRTAGCGYLQPRQRRQHVIDLFVWPENGAGRPNPDATDRNGYNVLRWNRNGMVFWAVSDISPVELAEFVRAWQGA